MIMSLEIYLMSGSFVTVFEEDFYSNEENMEAEEGRVTFDCWRG
jgi:hypothetical protein